MHVRTRPEQWTPQWQAGLAHVFPTQPQSA